MSKCQRAMLENGIAFCIQGKEKDTYCIHGYFKQDSETTYADQLLMLIRNAAAKENQMETEIKQEKEIA